MTQRELWRHPLTHEVAEVELHPGVARLSRSGAVIERRHSPSWLEEAKQAAAEHWNAMQEVGRKEMFGNLTIDDIQISPPQDATLFYQLTSELRAEGFVRHTDRLPDGSLRLPPVLEPWRDQLQASERGVVRLTGDPSRQPALWESKLGGVPYRPLGAPWPQAEEDLRPLVFLAQLNFSQLNPAGLNVPELPQTGLLQFFILNDMFYGAEADPWMSLNGAQTTSRVLYWPEVTEDVDALEPQAVSPRPDPADEGLTEIEDQLPNDLEREVALTGIPDREPVSGADGGAGGWLGVDPWSYCLPGTEATLSGPLYDLAAGGHKLGGYPNFTQSDPRAGADTELVLLFQLDSDDALGLMWGDGGTANFFIHPTDLAALNFSRVAYHWDCG
jgi:uncharacterized protein YwqG